MAHAQYQPVRAPTGRGGPWPPSDRSPSSLRSPRLRALLGSPQRWAAGRLVRIPRGPLVAAVVEVVAQDAREEAAVPDHGDRRLGAREDLQAGKRAERSGEEASGAVRRREGR